VLRTDHIVTQGLSKVIILVTIVFMAAPHTLAYPHALESLKVSTTATPASTCQSSAPESGTSANIAFSILGVISAILGILSSVYTCFHHRHAFVRPHAATAQQASHDDAHELSTVAPDTGPGRLLVVLPDDTRYAMCVRHPWPELDALQAPLGL
jgi:hypothetical protein